MFGKVFPRITGLGVPACSDFYLVGQVQLPFESKRARPVAT